MNTIFDHQWIGRLVRHWLPCAFATLLGCISPAKAQLAGSNSASPCAVIEGPAYLGARDPSKTSVVVFIHGVLSSAVGAWSADPSHSWPCFLRNEPSFDNSNIYLYGYQASLIDESPSIDKVARHLLTELKNDSVLNHAHITFIAHSMGGLITARMLLNLNSANDLRSMLDRVKLVNFFGTPALGSELAEIASQISSNVQFEEMKRQNDQTPLINQWAGVDWPFHWYCLAEGKNTGWGSSLGLGTRVVSKESAFALCRKRPPLSAETLESFNHITMVKPASLQDTPHRYLRRYFISCVADALPRNYPQSEASSTDGQILLHALHRLRNGMSDPSVEGRNARLSIVQDSLFQSDKWSDGYLSPSSIGQTSLTLKSFERLGGRPFSLEFIKLFDSNPNDLQPIWLGRLGNLDKYFPDGRLTELRQSWISAGYAADNDFALALRPRATGEQVVLLGSIQEVGGERKGRLRGLLILPAPPNTCV